MRYLDASALVKLYLDEPGSEPLGSEVSGRFDLLISDLTITETVSALARRARLRTAPPDSPSHLYQAILEHLDTGRFECTSFTPEIHREAERLMLAGVPLRAGDSLHLACATLAEAEALYTFDRQLAAAAHTLGLRVLP